MLNSTKMNFIMVINVNLQQANVEIPTIAGILTLIIMVNKSERLKTRHILIFISI